MAESLSKWTSDYIKAQQRANAGLLAPSTIKDSAVNRAIMSARNNAHTDFGLVPSTQEESGFSLGKLGSGIIEALTRPLNAISNVALDAVKNVQGDPGANNNPLLSAWEGLSGQKHTTGADIVGEVLPGSDASPAADAVASTASQLLGSTVPFLPTVVGSASSGRNLAKGVGGLTWDLGADPLNYIPGGTIAKGLSKGSKAAETVAKVADISSVDAAKIVEPKLLEAEVKAADTPIKAANTPVFEEPKAKLTDSKVIEDLTVTPKNTKVEPVDPIKRTDRNPLFDYAGGPDVIPGFGESRLAKDANGISKAAQAKVEKAANSAAIKGSNQKIVDAAHVANAAAPETVTPLAVTNIPRAVNRPSVVMGYAQGKAGERIIKQTVNDLTKTPEFSVAQGSARSDAIRSGALPTWKAAAEAEFAKGARPAVEATDGTQYALSTPHVLDALPAEGVNRMAFGAFPGKGNMYFSQINRGLAETLRLDDLHIPVEQRAGMVAEAMKKAVGPRARKVTEPQIQEAANFLVGQTPTIRNSQYEIAKTFVHKDIQDAAALSEAKSSQIMESLQSPTASTSEAIHAVSTVGSDIQASAKALGASDNAASIAAKETANLVAKVVPESDSVVARTMMANRNIRSKFGDTPYAQAKINAKQARWTTSVEKQTEALAKDLGIDTIDLATKADLHVQGLVSSLLHPIRSKFSFGYGASDLAEALRTGEQVADTNVVLYHRAMNRASKEVGKANFEAAFSAYKQGIVPVDEATKAAMEKIHLLVDHVFDTKSPLLGAFWRSGARLESINKELRAVGLPHQFKLPKGQTDLTNVADQWRTWDITDPMDFLDKANTALSRMAAKQAFGMSFSSTFGSKVPKAGMVKLTADEEKTFFGAFIDKSLYYPKEVAERMTRLEDIAQQPMSYRGQKGFIAAIANNIIDPVMQIWKPSVTIIRPGHHVRNLMGDTVMSYLDGVKSPNSYRKAKGMMSAGGSIHREGITGLEKLNGEELKNGAAFMTKVKLRGGKTADMTYDSGYQLAHKNGLLQTHLSHEDLSTSTNKLTTSIMNSAPLRGASWVSEKEGQFTTLAHWENLMNRQSFTRQFSTLEEAGAAAAIRARKFHPTVQGLTPFERRVMRRLIPFYSWSRQAIPAVLTTMLSHPGRVTALPKATYNAMIAVGMDPNSISDQFPEDKLYPSFVTNSLTGPVGGYAFNLGSPQEGVLGDILNSAGGQDTGILGAVENTPVGNVIGMANPILKAPIELATGKRLDSGANIADKGEYVDSNIPFVNQVAAISGYSPSGTLGNILSGAPALDPQRAVQRGEKENFFNTNLANFIAGLSLNNVDKPSYKKIAAQGG